MNTSFKTLGALLVLVVLPVSAASLKDNRAATANGEIEGDLNPATHVRAFKGVPFAAPPVGDLRWKAPQPAQDWVGVRPAKKFGPRAMQRPIFGDMGFRSDGMSEDCLYLNVWTPAKSEKQHLPVLVYFYGGGFQAGDGSESRYDGESMAQRGIVSVSVNYRLNIFGFLAHPELSAEAPYHGSGNYGLLDQAAALQWVQRNIAAFGGDPKRVTIAGESAGSISVSAQMASPLSKNLMAGAIGESGSILGALPPVPLDVAEKSGVAVAEKIGAKSLADLRAIPAKELLEDTAKPGLSRFPITIDGYFFPKDVPSIFAGGEQAHVPLLVGWNSEEMTGRVVLSQEPTPENFAKAVKRLYPDRADDALRAYAASTREEILQAATDLASDRFIAYSTWKWADLHGQTGGKPVYRYYFSRPRPAMTPEMGNATPGLAGGVTRGGNTNRPPTPAGAVHSAEIEYAMGNLPGNKVYGWTPEDFRVSQTMESYFANFVKTGNPNGRGVPKWPAANRGTEVQFMQIDVETRVVTERHRDRYLFLDDVANKKR